MNQRAGHAGLGFARFLEQHEPKEFLFAHFDEYPTLQHSMTGRPNRSTERKKPTPPSQGPCIGCGNRGSPNPCRRFPLLTELTIGSKVCTIGPSGVLP